MFAQLRTLLGLGLKSPYVRTYLAQSNLDTLRYQAVFFTFLPLLVFASTFAPLPPWTHHTIETLAVYRIGLIAIAGVNLAFHFICRSMADRTERHPVKSYFVLYSYATIMLAISVILTLFDYPINQNYFVYVLALVIVFGLLYIPPAFTIGALVISSAALVIGLNHLGYYGTVEQVTLYAYGFVAAIVSASNFHSRLRAGQANEQVNEISLHDELTGTQNRRALTEQAETLVGTPLFLLVGDIDEFKFYNDSFGHSAGDLILQEFARCMRNAFGADNVFRFGGDEFVALAKTDSRDEFEASIANWRKTFNGIELEGETYRPTTSAGYVGGIPTTGKDVLLMLQIADIRLYDAKEGGRNRVCGSVLTDMTPAQFLSDAANLSQHRTNHLDELTELPTMTYFSAHAKTVIDAPAYAEAEFAIVYFNVENLKIYNDRFGFTAGDELLVFIARTIEKSFEHNLVARFGGDRFIMLALQEGLTEGLERVHEAVRTFNPQSDTVIHMGIYPYERGMNISTACDRAKLACEHIKGRYDIYSYVYEEELLEAYNRQQFILDRFDSAIENGHLQVYYQPIMRTIGPRICGFEALARWIDPNGATLSPADFIPVLEEYRLIHKMDLEILRQICANYRTLADEGVQTVPVNINLSHFDLELCDIVAEVSAVMNRYDVPPAMVNIEVTESAFAKSRQLLRAVVERFHDCGMQVWMDDFGSGHSSFNILREFDFDVVKIDLRFLQHESARSRERSRSMLPHMISMAKGLGIQTLAEGVEEEVQYEFLKSIGCDKMQGFIFGRPGDFSHMRELLTNGELNVERLAMRKYFDAIGQVNLLHPTTIDESLSHDIELSSGLPAAVIEFFEGHVRYLLWNSSYLDYLIDIGMDTIENSEAQMNDLTRVQAQAFFRTAEQYKGTTEWINLTFYEENDLCTAMARCISVDDSTGAYSFVYIAFNLSKYLNRTGSQMPPIAQEPSHE